MVRPDAGAVRRYVVGLAGLAWLGAVPGPAVGPASGAAAAAEPPGGARVAPLTLSDSTADPADPADPVSPTRPLLTLDMLDRQQGGPSEASQGASPGVSQGGSQTSAGTPSQGRSAEAQATDGDPLAAGRRPPLTRDEVLESSLRHMPRILEAMAQFRAAQGDMVSAMGAFDLMVKSEGFARASGYYDGREVDGQVRQALGPFGAEVYGGYRFSGGDFPTYEDKSFTNKLGEARIGFVLSLLRDRQIDGRRGEVRRARIDRERAEIEVMLTQIGVQYQALSAYLRWIAAGLRQGIFVDLLALAEQRQEGLSRRVSAGDAAAILLTENRQNLARRATLVAQAKRDFVNAGLSLAQFYRDAAGEPETPDPARAPDGYPPIREGELMQVENDIQRARVARPELALIDASLDRARLSLALGRNELLPRLQFGSEVSRDFGAVDLGGPSRDSTDTIVKFSFSVPLQRRFAEGRISRAQAELDALRYRRQFTAERIELEVRRLVNDLRAAAETVRLADLEVDQAQTMQAAERRRFREGGSDFFVVNRREEATADARVRLVDAQLQYFEALANYRAATADLKALGIR
ncbi:hypothetical protein CCR85_01605 [Rhodothalassium salexigens]|nr:hypothetical protein [Rhodothalassium salexigens]